MNMPSAGVGQISPVENLRRIAIHLFLYHPTNVRVTLVTDVTLTSDLKKAPKKKKSREEVFRRFGKLRSHKKAPCQVGTLALMTIPLTPKAG